MIPNALTPQISLKRRLVAPRWQDSNQLAQIGSRSHHLPTFAGALVLTVFSLILLYRSGAALAIDRMLLFFVGANVVVLSGQLVVGCAVPGPFAGRLIIAIISGYAVATTSLLFGYFICGAGVATSFVIWSFLVVIASGFLCRGQQALARRLPILDLVLLIVPAATVCFFCRDIVAAVPALEKTGVLPLWVDYFIHGAEVAQFGAPGPWVKGDILLAGAPLPLYHYGIFMLPALVQVLFDLPGLAAASGFLLPLGLLLAYSGGVTLAVRLGGLRAGLFALALLLVPAGVQYGLSHAMFDFHWLLFTGPGTGYALAIASAALVLVERASTRNGAAIIVASLLVLLLFQVRAQIFVLLAPPFLVMAMLRMPAIRVRRRGAALAAGIASLGALIALACCPHLRDLVSGFSGANAFLESMSNDIDNRLGYGDFYRLVSSQPQPLANVGRAVLLVPLIFGYLLVIPLASLWLGLGRAKPSLKQIDVFFSLLLGWQFALLALAPAGQNGDSSEYAHRPFPLTYMIAVILLSAHAASVLRPGAAAPRMRITGATFTTAAISIALSAVLLAMATGFDPARGRMGWAATVYYRPVVDRGVVALASDLNRRTTPSEIIAIGPLDPASKLVDNGVIIASLANRAVYLATPALQLILGGDRAEAAKRRLKVQGAAEKALASGHYDAMRLADGVAWYVDTTDASHLVDEPVFANSFGRIYRVKPK